MTASYERINYALRPAKTIERKMLVATLGRLSQLASLSSYRYVGFGSPFFSDFVIVHKSLGIEDMISVEKDIENRQRFEFNRPFNCIKMRFGHSNDELPELTWGTRTIAWLDYDYPLHASVLADVAFFVMNASSGSVLIITVDAEPDALVAPEDPDDTRLRALERVVGNAKLPPGLAERDLDSGGTADVQRRIITNELEETLVKRNGGKAPGELIRFKQLFNFRYRDSARMMTVGGLLYDAGIEGRVRSCEFESDPYVRTSEEAYHITVPPLTHREMRHLDSQLPVPDLKGVSSPGVPSLLVQQYASVYKWFPTFAEAEL